MTCGATWKSQILGAVLAGTIGFRRNRPAWSGRLLAGCVTLTCLFGLNGCKDPAELSQKRAEQHVAGLVSVTVGDVEELRAGLPLGAKHLGSLYKGDKDPSADPQLAQQALQNARQKVLELRVAKSSFFALAAADGTVIRNDQEQDLMAGKKLFEPFPALAQVLKGDTVAALGEFEAADGVKGKPDAQWVIATPVAPEGAETVSGLFVSGWAWSVYCRRLEAALANQIADTEEGKKPLTYVFVLVGDKAYGTGPSPLVDAQAIEKLNPMASLTDGRFATQLQITGRSFGLAVAAAPVFGPNVGVAILRSET